MKQRKLFQFFNLSSADELQRLMIVVVSCILCLHVYVIFFAKVNHDEVEHLLVAWRILGGERPYLDFGQNHLPFYWYILAPFVKCFSHTLVPLYLGRLLSFTMFLTCFWLGTRLLRSIEGDRRFINGCLFFVSSIIYFEMEVFRIRPDVVMTLFATAGFYFMASSSRCDLKKSSLVGVLVGLGIAFMPKLLLVACVYPVVVLIFATPRSMLEMAKQLVVYVAGLALGILPILVYVWATSAEQEFFLMVFQLNAGLGKAFYKSFSFRESIGFAWWILGVGFVAAHRREFPADNKAMFTAAIAWVVLGFSILLIAGHSSLYNVQVVMIPLALTITYLFAQLATGKYRLPVAAALVIAFSFAQVPNIVANQMNGGGLYVGDFEKLVSYTEGGEKTCIGFAPVHPVYCKNVVPVSLIWDVVFLERAESQASRQYIRQKWERALRDIPRVDADIVVDRIPADVFGVALRAIVEDDRTRWERYRALQTYLDENYDTVEIEQPVDKSLRIRIKKPGR